MFSFEEKAVVLSSIRTLGFNRTVEIVAKMKRCSGPIMRTEMHKLDSNHYLLDNGIIEKTDAGVLRYVEFACPQQPVALTKEYFDSCKSPKQELFMEALSVMGMTNLLRTFKPQPIVKQTRYVKSSPTS